MNGLIAFFDILGYKSFLKNNLLEEAAFKVLDIIESAPTKAKEVFLDLFNSDEKVKILAETMEEVKPLVFSDTIVLTLEYPEGANEEWKWARRFAMSFFSGYLTAKMFMQGLPWRGAIHEGDFIIKEMCLAGNGFLVAYERSKSLNYSGLVFSSALGDKLQKESPRGFDQPFFVPYLSPKKYSEEPMLNYNWFLCMNKEMKTKCRQDVELSVLRAFWDWKKDCSVAVDEKVHNTSKLLRRLIVADESATESPTKKVITA